LHPAAQGSHYKVKQEGQAAMLMVPAHRPIKPWYIEALVELIDRVRESQS
jgi:hypothetical protein